MRWDRLFADLEAAADEIEKAETDGLAADLRDEMWSATSWRRLVGGEVTLDVAGMGQLTGQVAAINDQIVRIRSALVDHLVACSGVMSVLSSERRSDPPGRLDAAFGWPQALRRLRDAGEQVRVTLVDGRACDGHIDVVGADFVRLRTGDSWRLLTVSAMVVVTSTR